MTDLTQPELDPERVYRAIEEGVGEAVAGSMLTPPQLQWSIEHALLQSRATLLPAGYRLVDTKRPKIEMRAPVAAFFSVRTEDVYETVTEVVQENGNRVRLGDHGSTHFILVPPKAQP